MILEFICDFSLVKIIMVAYCDNERAPSIFINHRPIQSYHNVIDEIFDLLDVAGSTF